MKSALRVPPGFSLDAVVASHGWYQLARVHANRKEPEKARRIIAHLKNFEPKVAAQLERETGLAA